MSRPPAPPEEVPADPGSAGSDLDPDVAADLRRLRGLSHFLDDSIRIPGTTYRVGVEPLLGLLPVAGDAAGLVFSAYVLAVAVRTGVPRATLGRIVLTLWLDATVGSVPLLGDLFDAYWKANLRSTRLLDARLADPESAAADRRYLQRAGVLVACLGCLGLAGVVALGWWLAGMV
ncbi:DUF4112 domain-containing protein [Haloplanus sp.]|uniref:DUF4112 domain-containing protein n=1 Tax=Haloplanus sp. TaxID=1961696 RepID=UPI002609E049|nr:DUF4112 domain-containing protein [Haloplanus sp.]